MDRIYAREFSISRGIGKAIIISNRLADLIIEKSKRGKWHAGSYLQTYHSLPPTPFAIVGVSAQRGLNLVVKEV